MVGKEIQETDQISFQSDQDTDLQSYVDNTKLVISFKMKDSSEAFTNLRDGLHRIGQWCSNNLLLLNQSKTKLMVFDSK